MWPLKELAILVGGEISGDPDVMIAGAATVDRATLNQITFVTSQDYLETFSASPATAAIVPRTLSTAGSTKLFIVVDDPEAAFAKLVNQLIRPTVQRPQRTISPAANISPTARIGNNVAIYPNAVILDHVVIGDGATIYPNVTLMENCQIGNGVTIFPGAVLYENTIVGDRTIIHANAVLGAYGFGYSHDQGQHRLGHQLGNVQIEEDVEIGAGTTIDRGTFDSTVIGRGSKLDNLVMVGHNCQIGSHNLLCSQVGIAGSCQTGDYVVMGGQVGLADHLKVGNHVAIGAQSGLMHDIPDKQQVFGSPARPFRDQMQTLASLPRLPEMRQSIRRLEKAVRQLETNASAELIATELTAVSRAEETNKAKRAA